MNYIKIKTPIFILLSLLFISKQSYSQTAGKGDEIVEYSYQDTIRVFDSEKYTETVKIVPRKVSYHTNPEELPVLKSCGTSKDLSPINCTQNKLVAFLKKYVTYPKNIKNKGSETIRLSFIVKEDGSINYLMGKCQGNTFMINEAIRVMEILKEKETLTPFIPGKVNAKNVDTLMTLPVYFENKL